MLKPAVNPYKGMPRLKFTFECEHTDPEAKGWTCELTVEAYTMDQALDELYYKMLEFQGTPYECSGEFELIEVTRVHQD